MSRIIDTLKKQWSLVLLECLLLALFIGHVVTEKGQLFHWNFIDQLENMAYDARVILSTEESVDDRIVIVDIDEQSLLELGRWPWGRDKLAKLTHQLFTTYDVEIVGFDVVFAEPDQSSGLAILEQLGKTDFKDVQPYQQRLKRLRSRLDFDRLFIRSLKDKPVVLGYFFRSFAEDEEVVKAGKLPKPMFTAEDFPASDFAPPSAEGYGASLAEITKAAAGAGHFNPTLDDDGSVRRVPLFYDFDGKYYESLSLAMVRHLLEAEAIEPVYGFNFYKSFYNSPDYFRIGNRKIPVDEHSNVLVPYRGKEGSFPYISAVDVIKGEVDPALLKDRIVLVGSSAKGLFDLRTTPVQSALPGVEVHANLISGYF